MTNVSHPDLCTCNECAGREKVHTYSDLCTCPYCSAEKADVNYFPHPTPVAFPYQEIARLQRLLDQITIKHSEALRTVEELQKCIDNQRDIIERDIERGQEDVGETCEGPSEVSDYSQKQLAVEARREEWHHRQIALELSSKASRYEEGIIPLAEKFLAFLTSGQVSDSPTSLPDSE